MQTTVKSAAGGIALAIVVAGAIWIYHHGATLDEQIATVENVDLERAVGTSNRRSGGHVPDESSRGASTAAIRQRPRTFEQIKTEAERGSAVAQRELSELYGFCMPYSLNSSTQLQTLDHLASLAPDSKAGMDEVKARMITRCDGVDSGQPIPMEAVSLWATLAASSGDVASQVRLRVTSLDPLSSDEVSSLADAALVSRDPNAMLEMSNLMFRPMTGEISERYKGISGSPLAGAAWGIAACRAGASCGNGSMLMDSLCVSTGRCQHRSYEDFVFAQMVPPAERRRVLGMVQRISELGQP